MKEISFRPLRRIKKTGKIAVASYSSWRKLMSSDYYNFKLVIDSEYRNMPDDEYVYDSKGELLFWFDYKPQDIVNKPTPEQFIEWVKDKKIGGCCLNQGNLRPHFSGKGIDCDGIPAFNHYTADYISKLKYDPFIFEPLTSGMVKEWYGWLLLRLQNAEISVK